MLVLTRCPGRGHLATICIGQDVEITVQAIEGDEVRFLVATPSPGSISPDCTPRNFVPRSRPKLTERLGEGLTPPVSPGILSAQCQDKS